jgi:hypothetical protein
VLDTSSTTFSKIELERCERTYKEKVAASAEIDNIAEKFEKELFLMDCLSNIVYEDIEVWFVGNGSSHHMTRMR